VIVTLVVLAYILWNQLQVRVARQNLTLPLILIVIGAGDLSQYAARHVITPADAETLAASLLFIAIGLGAVRAYTVKLWRDGGKVLRQGTYITLALWLAGTAVHVGLESLARGASATDLLYLGLTLAAQRLVLQVRVRNL
jgi:uncharacterized membrane protein